MDSGDGRQSRLRYMTVEISLLLTVMLVVGMVVVPSHWSSLWMDREFTGWVAPISNRMHDGLILYSEHGHMPMPPGPFVLIEVLTQGQATWWTESLLNFVFQSLTLLVAYLALSLLWRPPIPFIATLASMGFFYALQKSIFYDSSAQFFAAVGGLLALIYLRSLGERSGRADYGRLMALAFIAAVTVIFKQSTGAGLCLGLGLAVLFASPLPWKQRLLHASYLTLTTVVCFAAITLALTPWIDPKGMLDDVFLHGSEAKGGARQLVKNVLTYVYEAAQHVAWFSMLAAVMLGVFRCKLRTDEEQTEESHPPTVDPFPVSPWLLYAGSLLVPLALVLVSAHSKRILTLCQHVEQTSMVVTWVGLLTTLVVALKVWFPRRLAAIRSNQTSRPFAGLLIVFFLVAVGHTLSVWWFRWTYDNNPLIPLVFGTMIGVILTGIPRPEGPLPWSRRAVLLGICLMLQALTWSSFALQYEACEKCTESWPEVGYLHRARMTRSAVGMRNLVAVVQQAAPDRDNDRVLLLPNDPNVEAWLERKPPELSSVILFADQYLDRRVEPDLAALRANPPRVVVVGPKNFWRSFHHNWNEGYGAERFIDAMNATVLPELYDLYAVVPISHNRKQDVMEVYIRKETRGNSR